MNSHTDDMWEESAPGTGSEAMSGPILFYTDKLIDHFRNPRHAGELPEGETDGMARIGDPACGDEMVLRIRVREGRIDGIAFKSFGCPGAIATSSALCELAMGRSLVDALEISDDDVIDALGGIPENKRHCSLLGVKALHAAIADYQARQESGCLWQ